MNGMLGLSMTPLASAVRLAGVSYSSTESRYILNMNGTQHVQLDSKITIAGPCEIELYGQWPVAGGGWLFSDTTSSNEDSSRFVVGVNTQLYGWGFDGYDIDGVDANKISHIRYVRDADSNVYLYINSALVASIFYDGDININAFFRRNSGTTSTRNFNGIMFDLSIKQSGLLTNKWAIDDNTGTLIDSVRGNNGTLINHVPDDWEKIEKKRGWDYWLGVELVNLNTFNTTDWSVLTNNSAEVVTTKQISGAATLYDSIARLLVGAIYTVYFESYDWFGDGAVGLSVEAFGGSEGVSINDRSLSGNGVFDKDLVATGNTLSFFRYVSTGQGSGGIKNVSILRKLEIAQ